MKHGSSHLTRRDFLKIGAVTGAATVWLPPVFGTVHSLPAQDIPVAQHALMVARVFSEASTHDKAFVRIQASVQIECPADSIRVAITLTGHGFSPQGRRIAVCLAQSKSHVSFPGPDREGQEIRFQRVIDLSAIQGLGESALSAQVAIQLEEGSLTLVDEMMIRDMEPYL